jgi:hypothetical protein
LGGLAGQKLDEHKTRLRRVSIEALLRTGEANPRVAVTEGTAGYSGKI